MPRSKIRTTARIMAQVVCVTDEDLFPNIAEARRWAQARRMAQDCTEGRTAAE